MIPQAKLEKRIELLSIMLNASQVAKFYQSQINDDTNAFLLADFKKTIATSESIFGRSLSELNHLAAKNNAVDLGPVKSN